MAGAAQNMLVKVLTKHAPRLFYYTADKIARANISIQTSPAHVDVINNESRRVIRIDRTHAIYISNVIECFDYYSSSVRGEKYYLNGQHYSLYDFSVPKAHKVYGFDDFPVNFPSFPETYVTGKQYLEFADLKSGATVLDLGAYSAFATILFAKTVGAQGHVVALEPDPQNYAIAASNVAAYEATSGLHNIELVQGAVTGTGGTLSLSSEGNLGSAATRFVGAHRGNVVRVEAFTLTQLAERHRLASVDFIKMDIEGAEEEVIANAREFFVRFRPKLIIEPHQVNGVRSDDAVIRLLTAYGYSCEIIPQTGVSSLPLITATPLPD